MRILLQRFFCVCILPDTLAVKEDTPFEIYEHFYGNVTVGDYFLYNIKF